MNNQTSATKNTQDNMQNKSNSSKLKTIYFLKHVTIPFTTLFGAIGLLIGFVTAVHWSIAVTGNTGYTGYIFGNVTTSMVLMIFGGLLAYSALPFFSGYFAVKISNYRKLEKISAERHAKVSIYILLVYVLSFIICYLAYKNKWSHSVYIIYIIIFLFLFFWGSFYYFVSLENKNYGNKIKNSILFPVEFRNKINNLSLDKMVTLLGFILYVFIGNVTGILISLSDITASSISDIKIDFFSLLGVFSIPLLLTLSGIIYASDENKNQPLLISLIVALALILLDIDVPQNAIISLNHGIVKTQKVLKTEISSASKNTDQKCSTMYVIKRTNYTLFSCGEQKGALKGKIFYQTKSRDAIEMITDEKKFVPTAYCVNANKNDKNLVCVYGYNLQSVSKDGKE